MITLERARKLREMIVKASKFLTDNDALESIELYPKWEIGKAYEKDFRLRYEDTLYKVLQNHTSQSDWTPDVAVSLFVKVSIEEYPDWVQPTGAHDAYNKGDKVTHLEKHWESEIDANVYEPSVYGWKEC